MRSVSFDEYLTSTRRNRNACCCRDGNQHRNWARYSSDKAEMLRIKGELLLMRDGRAIAEAEGCFSAALDVARAQEARWWQLRATTSLARLLRDRDRRDEARTTLAEVYGWFTEGFDTADLKDAKALLDELSA